MWDMRFNLNWYQCVPRANVWLAGHWRKDTQIPDGCTLYGDSMNIRSRPQSSARAGLLHSSPLWVDFRSVSQIPGVKSNFRNTRSLSIFCRMYCLWHFRWGKRDNPVGVSSQTVNLDAVGTSDFLYRPCTGAGLFTTASNRALFFNQTLKVSLAEWTRLGPRKGTG